MQAKDPEFTKLSKGLKVKFPFEFMFLYPGHNFLGGEADHLFLEK